MHQKKIKNLISFPKCDLSSNILFKTQGDVKHLNSFVDFNKLESGQNSYYLRPF